MSIDNHIKYIQDTKTLPFSPIIIHTPCILEQFVENNTAKYENDNPPKISNSSITTETPQSFQTQHYVFICHL
jgi:hypothetical protein